LCKTPELACEVTLQPLERFDLDAAILFSDILTIPDAMGLGLSLNEGEGPRFARPLRSAADVASLIRPDPESNLRYVMDAVRLIRRELNGRVPLIGFSGSPWTLATYMVEGQSSRDFSIVKSMIYQEPSVARQLLGILSESIALYLRAQAHAGAQVLMVFDTWGGALGHAEYRHFSLDPMAQIVEALRADPVAGALPIIVFTKGGGQWLSRISEIGCDALGCDWTTSLREARRLVQDRVALQGNLDPAVLNASPEKIRSAVGDVLEDYGPGPGHIFNLGHGITPGINPDRVKVLVDSVHELSRTAS
jgi:uroporphyrinogen decarboxylase